MRIRTKEFGCQAKFFLLLASCIFFKAVTCISDPFETAALLAFRNNLVDPSGNLDSWTGDDPCGGWRGVYCEAQGPNNVSHITELRLFQYNLSGSLVPELGNLSYLNFFNVMWNNLSGSIPRTLGNLKNLYLLLLNGNNFSGNLPAELGQLTNLTRLQIDQNNFTGPVPSSFGNLTSIVHLHMNNNSLTGSIPPELGNLPNVVHILLDNNNLTGPLPQEVANAPNLLIIELDNNQFQGNDSIPTAWGNIPTLLKLSLRNCSLQGTIPNISRLSQLMVLDLSDNDLTGPLPNITYPANLTTIDLSNNLLNGTLPLGIGNLQNMQALSIADNQISGSLPANLGTAKVFKRQLLTLLDLQNNYITSISSTNLVDLSSTTGTRVWLAGNAICKGESALNNPICVPHDDVTLTESDIFTSPSASSSNCSCFLPLVVTSSCRCVQPITVDFRLKSPSFQFFDSYETTFVSWFANGLNVSENDVTIQDAHWQGGRLVMTIFLLPDTGVVFTASDFYRLYTALSRWQIPDNDVLGPYELLSFEPQIYTGSEITSADHDITKGAIAGIVLGVSAFMISVLLLLWAYLHHRHLPDKNRRLASIKRREANIDLKVAGLTAFSFEDLAQVTDQFNPKNEVGEGGYGKVYRGVLKDGKVVAIKRAEIGSLQGAHEFHTEIELLSRVHHRNLVMLVGYCNHGIEQMLVYEYMPGGTLRDHLKESSKAPLDFASRLAIALGSARGILYLHTEANPPIFHRDIKGSNILLDEKNIAKVADFGLSKLAPVPDVEGETPDHISTVVKGTPGYLDPEYFLTHKLTDKSDVYSFGVVLLELVTGRLPIYKGKNIVREVSASYEAGTYLLFVDQRMGVYPEDALQLMVQLALACCREVPAERPNMADVVRELETIWRSTNSMHSSGSIDLRYSKPLHSSKPLQVAPPFSQDRSNSIISSVFSSMDLEQETDSTQLMSKTIRYVPPR